MSAASASGVEFGCRKESTREVRSAEARTEEHLQVDLRQITVIAKSDWQRIQNSLNHENKQHRDLIAAAKQREALHLQSKEVVKNWSNTIVGQRQKRLEAKKIREEAKEEERKQIDSEEAKYQEEKRKEEIKRAKSLLFNQTDRVKGLHSALMLTEVLKERDAQIKLKKRKEMVDKDMDKEMVAMFKRKEVQALQKDLQKAIEKKQENLTVAQSLKQQIKKHDEAKEQEKLKKQEEAEKLLQVQELDLEEQEKCEQKKLEQRRNIIRAHQEHLANRDMVQSLEAERQKEEEEKRKLFVKNKDKMMKLRREKEQELLRQIQKQREVIAEGLAAHYQKKAVNEDELINKAAAEAEAKAKKQQQEKDEKKAAMLKSISEHREAEKQEQVHKEQEEKRKDIEILKAKKEADIFFLQRNLMKAQKIKEKAKSLQNFNVKQMAQKNAQELRVKQQQQEHDMKNAILIAEEENQFQHYAQQVIQQASEAHKITYPLRKAAREGIGGGLGPICGGFRPSYLVQDQSGVQMPSYSGNTTQNIKKLNETTDIQQAKKRLGFTW